MDVRLADERLEHLGQDVGGDTGMGDLPGTLDGTVTIMFSDIAGYTAMNDRLGDLAAHDLLTRHNRIVRDLLATHRGYEVKSQGDGFMVAFSSAGRNTSKSTTRTIVSSGSPQSDNRFN